MLVYPKGIMYTGVKPETSASSSTSTCYSTDRSRACWRRPTSGPEIMDKVQYPVGDMIFAAEDIYNDGGMPASRTKKA